MYTMLRFAGSAILRFHGERRPKHRLGEMSVRQLASGGFHVRACLGRACQVPSHEAEDVSQPYDRLGEGRVASYLVVDEGGP